MSRKTRLIEIVTQYDAHLQAHENRVEEIQRNRDLSTEGQMRKMVESRSILRGHAEQCRNAGMAVMAEAREELERRIQERPDDYQLQLANALTMAQMSKNMTPAGVRQLFKPFMYDESAYSALAGTIKRIADTEQIMAIPSTDLPRVRKYMDELELYLQRRVDRLTRGPENGSFADPVEKWANSDMYTIFITRVIDRMNDDLTGLASDDDDGAA